MIDAPLPDRLRTILRLVEDCLDEPELTGAELAGRAHLSRFHFDRLVTAALGEAPGAFRRRLLLERAAYQLGSTADPVIDVAVTAGYGSAEAFTRAFTRAYGRAPSVFRSRPRAGYRLPTPNGVHFHPPGGLRLPDPHRSAPMDVLAKMLDHHLTVSAQILERTAGLPDDLLDRRLLTVEGIDSPPTLRATAVRLVTQLEMWNAVLDDAAPAPGEAPDVAELPDRLAAAAPRFRELVLEPVVDGHGDDTFLDVSCDPPQTFSRAGVLAHVLTFAAVRRTLAIGALESAGIDDLGSGDPMSFVGGSGEDAARISRAAR